MRGAARRKTLRVGLRLPFAALVLAYTAVPTGLRPVAIGGVLDPHLDIADLLANILGYIPLGFVLCGMGIGRAIAIAAGLSAFAEISQIVSPGRSPSIIDLAANVAGAWIGFAAATVWGVRATDIAIGRSVATAAFCCALAYLSVAPDFTLESIEAYAKAAVTAPGWAPSNDRGLSAPGQLEAHWSFDGGDGAATPDATGRRLSGTLVNAPSFSPSILNRAVELNGRDQWIDVAATVPLRLAGSMTISALVRADRFPASDAAIVSVRDRYGLGYQLDTTVDEGPRTIGFRLTDAWGRPMERYGRTPLEPGRWYYVAGVYDAEHKTLDVYLDGRLDNGCLRGVVTSRQHVSGGDLSLGRVPGQAGFEFAGALDDIKIFSRALSRDELAAEVESARTGSPGMTIEPLLAASGASAGAPSYGRCAEAEAAGSRFVGPAFTLGLLLAVGCMGLWPTSHYRLPCLGAALAGAAILLLRTAHNVPDGTAWLIPGLVLAGAMVALASVRR